MATDYKRLVDALQSIGVAFEEREYMERDSIILIGGTDRVGGYHTSFAEFKFHKDGSFDRAGVYSTKPQRSSRERRTMAAPPPIKGA